MAATLPASLLSSLSSLLAARLGLHFPVERWDQLERGIAAAAPAFGMPDATSCAQRILSAPLTHQEIEILASCLTVGETYFFREPRSFEVLEQHILPALLRARAHAGRQLRIWSAGCCTGEEPYSIAMLLDRLIPSRASWNTTILATDINPEFLRKAAEGEYGEWSFRNTPRWIRECYFQRGKNGRFRLRASIRQQVSFSCLNLADDSYPSLTSNTNAMDVIFCRNVLMYFTAERARAVAGNLYHSLVDGGWLIVSPAETSSTLFPHFTTVEFDGAILYQKNAAAEAPRFVSHLTPLAGLPQASWHLPAQHMPPAATLPVPPAAPPALSASGDGSQPPEHPRFEPPGRMARDYANQGRLAEAAEWCRQAIAADKLNPSLHYLLATIQMEQGQASDATHSLTRALYLDPDFVLAHYALGNLRQSQGQQREAQRHFGNALAALQTHPPSSILPESDGLTAGRLTEIIVSMQSAMPRPSART